MLKKIKESRNLKLWLIVIAMMITLFFATTYAFFSAKVSKVNQTSTSLKSDRLGLIYTGVTEVNAANMIPGDEFVKTFNVENISDSDINFNIFFENVQNTFGKDLVYSIVDDEGQVVEEAIMPKTKEGKSYLKTAIPIEARQLINYTMTIKFKYLENEDQYSANNQFTGTVGIDTEPTAEVEGLYRLNINPNGGIYEESGEVRTYVLATGESVTLATPTRPYYTFEGWTIEEETLDTESVTMGENDITVVANWSLNGDIVARINDNYYSSIQNAFNAAVAGDTVVLLKDTTEVSSNSKNVTLDLDEHKVTGSITNSGNLTIIDGVIENEDGSAVTNTGTLVLGQDDGEVSVDSVALIGTNKGIDQRGTFNFYDGFIEGKVGIYGGYNRVPVGYYVFVDHNNQKDCQKVYLTDTPSKAIVKTVGEVETLYVNLQDAIDVAVETNEPIVAIRGEFEVPYTVTIPANKTIDFDINGKAIKPGYAITNNGTFIIKDTASDKGYIRLAVGIENNGTLTLNGASLTEEADSTANIINNKGALNSTNSIITGIQGYAISSGENSTLNLDNNTMLKANGYALHVESGKSLTVNKGKIDGVYNEGNLTVTGGTVTNGPNEYIIYNNAGTLTYNGAELSSTKSGIYIGSSTTCDYESGKLETTSTAIANAGTFNLSGGQITSTNGVGISGGTVNTTGTPTVTSKGVAIANGTVNIDGGTFTSTDSVGVYNGGGTSTIKSGTIISEKGYGAQINCSRTSSFGGCLDYGRLNIQGGTITGYTRGVNADGPGALDITGGTITGQTDRGVYTTTETTIKGATINGENYGVHSTSTLTIGTNNEIIENVPLIIGKEYGLYIASGTVNYYDGILKGITDAYYGDIAAIPDASYIKATTEVINSEQYKVNSLAQLEPFCRIVGGENYNSLQKAIGDIEETGTIELTDSPLIKSDVTIPEGKTITLKLMGETYTSSQSIINNGTLNIVGPGTITTNEDVYNIINNATGTMTISNVTINKNYNSTYAIHNYGSLEINNVTIDSLAGGIYDEGGSSVTTFNSGTIISKSQYAVSNGGTFNLIDGTITSENGDAMAGGTIVITDGTVTSKGTTIVNSNATINGGTITSQTGVAIYNGSGKSIVNDGIITGATYGMQMLCGYSSWWSGCTQVGYSEVNGGSITGGQRGINATGPGTLDITGGTITGQADRGVYTEVVTTIKGATIKGENYGVHSTNTLTIGTNNETLENVPVLQGKVNGLYSTSSTINYYDGIIKGIDAAKDAAIAAIPDATYIKDGSEVIGEDTYLINEIKPLDNFCHVVGGDDYNSLQKAIDAIGETGEIELTGSPLIKSPVTIPAGKNITLNLKGFTYTTTQSITNNGSLTIKDEGGEGIGTLATAEPVDLLVNNGTLNITKASFNKTNATNYVLNNASTGIATIDYMEATSSGTEISNYGTLTIKDGVFDADITPITSSYGSTFNLQGGTITSRTSGIAIGSNVSFTATGGTIVAEGIGIQDGGGTLENISVTSNTSYGLTSTAGVYTIKSGATIKGATEGVHLECGWRCYSTGSVVVEGGTITGQSSYGISATGIGTVKVSGGSITGATDGIHSDIGTTITGGHITGENYGVYMNSNLTLGTNGHAFDATSPVLTGGYYGLYIQSGSIAYYDGVLKGKTDGYYGKFTDIADHNHVAIGSEVIDNETYVKNYLEVDREVIRNDTKPEVYNNIYDAFYNATDGDEFTLLKDTDVYYEISNSKNISLNMNGKNIYTSKMITNTGTMTITGTGSTISTHANINIFENHGTLSITGLSLVNTATNPYVITNYGTLSVDSININAVNGIRGYANTTTTITDSNINVTSTAAQTDAGMDISGGTIHGDSYAVYTSTTQDNEITGASLSGGNALYKASTEKTELDTVTVTGGVVNNAGGTLEIEKTNITGNLYNNNAAGTVKYTDGTIGNSEAQSSIIVLINNKGTMELSKITVNGYLADNWGSYEAIINDGTITIKDNSKIYVTKKAAYGATAIALNNRGTATMTGGVLSSVNISRAGTHEGIYNTGNVILTSVDITTDKANIAYGIYNAGVITMNSGNINATDSNTAYGIYSANDGNELTLLSGKVNVTGNTVYGAYINNGTLTLGEYDGSGTSTANVSTTDPSIKAIGTTSGIGVKKMDGFFKYYDGIITGSTSAKPDNTSLIEYNYEAVDHVDGDGYNYCILEYME